MYVWEDVHMNMGERFNEWGSWCVECDGEIF